MKTILPNIKGRTRCPYLAIPIPGERPFVVSREMFERVTRDITITDTSLDKLTVESHGKIWALTIVHRTGKARGRCVLYNLLQTTFAHNYWTFKLAMYKWAESHRDKPVRNSTTKFDKLIDKLERELGRVREDVSGPWHPLLPPKAGYGTSRYYAASELEWHKTRADRKRIARVAGLVLKNHITERTGYEMLREMGYKIKRFSALGVGERRREKIGGTDAYWRTVYSFCGITSLHVSNLWNRQGGDLTQELQRHAESRVEYLQDKRHAESLRIQIASIKKLAAVVPIARPETGLIAA